MVKEKDRDYMASEKYFKQFASSFTAINPANMPGSVQELTLIVTNIVGFKASAFAEVPYMNNVNGVETLGTIRCRIQAVDIDNSTITLKVAPQNAQLDAPHQKVQQLMPKRIQVGDIVQPRQPKANLKGDVLSFAYEVEPINAIRVMTVDESGNYVAGGGGGGGGGSDTTAANQVLEINRLASIDGKLTGQATAVKQDQQTALLTTVDASLNAIEASVAGVSTLAEQQLQTTALSAANSSLDAIEADSASLPLIQTDTASIDASTALVAAATNINVVAPAAGHAPRNMLVGGMYNSTPPALTAGQQAELQVDASGNLRIAPANVASGAANEFETTTGLLALQSITHSFTAVVDSLLTQIEASSSGQMKYEVYVNGNPVWVKFSNAADLNVTFNPREFSFVATGQLVEVIITSMETVSAHNVYSTISTRNA